MDGIMKLVGVYGLTAFLIYVGYLFYDKNPIISIALVIVGVIIAIYVIWSEIKLKKDIERYH